MTAAVRDQLSAPAAPVAGFCDGERRTPEGSASRGARGWKERNIGWTGSFYIMCITHVLGVSLKNQLFEFTTIVLANDVASLGNGLLFFCNIFVAFFAGAIVSQLGCTWSQALGHVLMLVFVGLLSVCVFLGEESWLQWPFYIAGVLIASFAQPIENTMMGPLFERTARVLVSESADSTTAVYSMRSSLMSTFTIIVGSLHIIVNASTGALLGVLQRARDEDFAIKVMFPCLTLIIFLALALMVFVREPPRADGTDDRKSWRREVRNMCGLWQDPRIWLLGFAPLSLGLANAWKLVTLAPEAKINLGADAVAYLLTAQAVVQIVLPKIISSIMPRTGSGVWIGLASLNYLLMPVLFWTSRSLTQSWGIMTWYAMMGVAWSIYDVVARSVVLEHFPKEQASYAFATMNLQMFSTQALIFFLRPLLTPGELAGFMLAVSACMLPGYLVAEWLRARRAAPEAGTPDKKESESV